MKQESVWFTTRIRNTRTWEEMLTTRDDYHADWGWTVWPKMIWCYWCPHTLIIIIFSSNNNISTLYISLSVCETIFGVVLHIAISVRLGGTILSLSQEHYDSVSYKHWLKILTTVHCSHNTPCNWIFHNILSLQAVSGRYDFKFCCFFRFNSLQASCNKNFRSDSIQAMQVSNMNGWLSCILS